jgi:hypothetical protein
MVEDAEEHTGITQQQVSKWAKRLKDREAYREKLFGPSWKAAMVLATAHVSHNSGQNEWYTPRRYIDVGLVRQQGASAALWGRVAILEVRWQST